jgi:hypothetical protein
VNLRRQKPEEPSEAVVLSRVQSTTHLSRGFVPPSPSPDLQAIAQLIGSQVYDSTVAGQQAGLAGSESAAAGRWISPTESFRIFPRLRR